MKWIKNILIFVVVLAGVLGWKFYNKSQTKAEAKTQLTAICASNQALEKECVTAIDSYYEDCFESSYSLGGRRTSGGLDSEQLANCINTKSGKQWFAVQQN